MKILVTGFDPFGGEEVNPAIETVKRLPDTIGGAKIIKLEIPTVCHQSLRVIDEAIAGYDPDVVLSVGQAGGRPDITVGVWGSMWMTAESQIMRGIRLLTNPYMQTGRRPIS